MRGERPIVGFLQLFALSGFAVAAPVFDLLGRNPEFLIAHKVAPTELALLVVALLFVPALLAWLAELALGALGRRTRGAVHWLLIGALLAVTLLPPADRLLSAPGSVTLALVAAIGVLAAVASARLRVLRTLWTVLGAAPLVFAASFLLSDPIARVRGASAWSPPDVGPFATQTHVVMVVFDALPLITLLDADQTIDAGRFPGFAALAKRSTWFRNTTAAADVTNYALPAILTGRYPDASLLPTVGDHPGNLFTLLRGTHSMLVNEPRTMLMPIRDNLPVEDVGELDSTLLSDLAVLYAHVLAPGEWGHRLPPVSRDWKNFRRRPANTEKLESKVYGDRPAQFARFIDAIDSCSRPCLDFLHVIFPHTPWEHMPSGRSYSPIFVPGIEDGRWKSFGWWVEQGYQRHLFHAILADQLLLQLLERLEEVDLLARTVLVVVADHGASFWPGERRRLIDGHRHPEDILRVPFFIAAPGQRTGAVSDRRVQTIDVLPTIADLLEIELPWPVDGTSALAANFPDRPERTSYTSEGLPLRFADDLDVSESLARKLRVFGSGAGAESLFAIGRHRALLGRPLAELEQGEASHCRIEIASESFVLNDNHVPSRISGFVHCDPRPRTPPQLAIGISGVIRGVAPTFETTTGRWMYSTFIPEDAITTHQVDLGVYLVDDGPGGAVLHAAPFALAEIGLDVVNAVLREPADPDRSGAGRDSR